MQQRPRRCRSGCHGVRVPGLERRSASAWMLANEARTAASPAVATFCPTTPGDSEAGAEFAAVFQPGGAVAPGEGELLGHVRDRAAHQMEGDPAGPVEGDRLQRDGGQPAAVDRV
jgi:hypothetical protein